MTIVTSNVPDWIRVSDLWVSMCSGSDSAELAEGIDLSTLPQCSLDCGDAIRMYTVMGAWCFSWDRVPKAVFLPQWLELTVAKRNELLLKYRYFTEELHINLWIDRMYDRDDVTMLAAVTTRYKLSIGTITKFPGAIRCLRYAHEHGFPNYGFPR